MSQQQRSNAFVLEIAGRAVLAFSADGIEQAQALCDQAWFTRELVIYRSCGIPIWDSAAEMRVRCAGIEEAAELEVALATEKARGEYDGIAFAFLVPVDATSQ